MTADDDDNTGDLLIGLNRIAQHIGVTAEGVRYLWAQGRVPVTKFGQFWLANRSALTKAMENDSIRTRRGRKTDAERAAIQAIMTEAPPQISNSTAGGKQGEGHARILKSKVKSKAAAKPKPRAKKA